MPPRLIQFVNADPIDDAPVGIDEEKRQIQNIWGKDAHFFDAPAARLTDLAFALRNNKPEIVHFIGHGNQFNELMLLNDDNKPYGADKSVIRELFELYQGSVGLVILNACHSNRQAELIFEHIESVIGINQTIQDDLARRYAVHLHRLLHEHGDIKAAHEEATLILRDQRIERELWPQLWTRAKASPPATIASELQKTWDEREQQFAKDFDKYGVSADCLTLKKICDAAGCSVIEYEIEGLTVNEGNIAKVYFQLETTAGLIRDPQLDSRADRLGIYWQPVKKPEPVTFLDVLDAARSIKGYFCFSQKLTKKTGPYTFGWSLTIYNMDALSKWDFDNLYVTESDRLHVDGSPLRPAREYIARLVWVPAKRLQIRVSLPPNLGEPRFRYFEPVSDTRIDKEQILSRGILLSMPPEGLDPNEPGTKWEPRPRIEALEKSSVTHETVGSARISELSIKWPSLGSWFALDWLVNDLKLYGLFLRFRTESEAIRKRLVEHRKMRLKKQTTPNSGAITAVLGGLHRKLRARFPEGGSDEIFESSFFSFDAKSRRLVMCERFVNDAAEGPEELWDMELPYGMGLVGTCFRLGNGIVAYAKGDRAGNEETETYLRIPNSPEHEYLLAVPIDHPQLTLELAANQDVQRSRQLIGVLTIGSTYAPSSLQEFCVFPPEDGPDYEKWQSAAQAFRDDCQRECDALALLLERGESGGNAAAAASHL